MNNSSPVVTIVICTYNRAELLQHALESLAKENATLESFEVLIVDNNSSDNTQEIAQQFCNDNSNFHITTEQQQGLSYARNRGYHESTSDWIAYMDDDACASENYIERMLHVINNYNFDCFGGIYLPWYKYGKPTWFKDTYGSSGCVLPKIGVLTKGFASGGNIVIRKSILEELNGFNTNIGMTGKTVSYGEEVLLQVRMRKHGYVIGFDPELKIDHLVNIYKQTPFWFILSSYAVGRDHWTTHQVDATWPTILRILLGAIKQLAKELVYRTPSLFRKNYYIQNWFIDVFRHFTYSIGCIISGISNILAGSKT